jgi:hypothetical protein
MKPINKQWISWAKNQVSFLKDGGYLIFPADGAIFQINKVAKTITLVCCKPTWLNSEIESTNEQVFSRFDFRYIKEKNVPTNPDAIIDKIFDNLQKYASDIPTLLHGVGVIFGLKHETQGDDNKLLSLIENKGKKLPINPVTIRGEGNFTAGRLWIAANSIQDTSHRFNPANRGPRWEKPVTILLWREGQNLSTDDPNCPAMIVDEAEFIDFVKSLSSLNPAVKLWGQTNRVNEHQKMFICIPATFSSQDEKLNIKLYKFNDDEQILVGEVVLDLEKFKEGLGHLFPNGELS